MDLELESRPVIVLASARTGTHLLRKTLGCSDDFHDFGEVFLPNDWPNRSGSFWDYYRGWLQVEPDRLVTTAENRSSLFADYLAELDQLCDAPFMLIDIKYGSVANLNPCYHQPDQEPFLFKLIREQNIPVIHLMRRNILQQHCSELLANQNEQWEVPIKAKIPVLTNQSIVVDVKQLVDQLTRKVLRVQFFDGYLSQYERYLRLHYEDLLENGLLADRTVQLIGQLLSRLLVIDGIPQTRKMSPPLSLLIENYSEVEKTLKGTPFEEMLEGGAPGQPAQSAGDVTAAIAHLAG